MPVLHELQRSFAASLYGRQTPIGRWVRSGGLAPERRLAVYRNNTRLGLRQALRDTYPVVERLVGAGFFDHAADAYGLRHPLRRGDLHAYGAAFADFLEDFAPAAGLPYLPDMARLEWAIDEAYHAADTPPVDLAGLQRLAPHRREQARFRLAPSARLLASPHPLPAIRRAALEPESATVRLDAGGCRLLVIRRALEVEIETLDRGVHAWLTRLQAGATLGAAVAHALSHDPRFDLRSSLIDHVLRGTLTPAHADPATPPADAEEPDHV